MKTFLILLVSVCLLFVGQTQTSAEVKTLVEHNDNDNASAAFKFKTVPAPSKTDAATKAKFRIIQGERDENGGSLDKLNDGKLPTEQDQPEENFFFNAGTKGGKLLLDLGNAVEIKQINTYSWHPNTRGPQVYKLYGNEGKGDDFKPEFKAEADAQKAGWKQIASVDTRPKSGDVGGQYGVSISDSDGALGKFRYLVFDVSQTEADDDFGNTFFSEIDVVANDAEAKTAATEPPFVIRSADGYCEISIDTSAAPNLKEWAETKLAPVLAEWYPKITTLLPSGGYEPPKKFSVVIAPGRGVAATGGTKVTANSKWLENELNREAVGSIVHEEVHVVQQYRNARRNNPDAKRAPGWLVEGIPDYIRWFKFEPQSHGAEISQRRFADANYDKLYRVTANFLNFVVGQYGEGIITKMNAACRQGTYTDDLWKTETGKTIAELNDDWKAGLRKKLGIAETAFSTKGSGGGDSDGSGPGSTDSSSEAINTLTAAEKAAGWQLLFNGKDMEGWHNFRAEGVRPGWQVKDGALVCVDPKNAGDIVTVGQYGWFELQLDYNISHAGNSGIMYHVTEEGGAAWATGPEFQLEDNEAAADKIRCGWLYALYQPPDDPKTGKPLDATKPVGEWNHIRLLISKDKCEHDINGVKYFEYVLGSEDFNNRVAKSKFGRMPKFAKSEAGSIALQGDHGMVSFRNIKIRQVK